MARDVKIRLGFETDTQSLNDALSKAQTRGQNLRAQSGAVGGSEHLRLLREQLANQKLQADLQRREQFEAWRMQYGYGGAKVMQAADMRDAVANGFRTVMGGISSTLAMVGVGTGMSALASAAGPAASETFFGSLRLLAGEISIVLMPQLMDFAMLVQRGAHWIRSLSQETVTTIQRVAFWGVTIASGAWVLSKFIGGLRLAYTTLGSIGVSSGLMAKFGALAGATGLVIAAFQAMEMYLNSRNSENRNAAQRAQQLAAGGQANSGDWNALTDAQRARLVAAQTPAERQRLARQMALGLSMQQPFGGATAEGITNLEANNNETAAQYRQRRIAEELASIAATHGVNSWRYRSYQISSWMPWSAQAQYGDEFAQQINRRRPIVQRQHQIGALTSIAQNGVIPDANLERGANMFRMAFGTGGFQSQEIALENMHSMVQQAAIRDPMQQAQFEQQQRAREAFLQWLTAQQGATMPDIYAAIMRLVTGATTN